MKKLLISIVLITFLFPFSTLAETFYKDSSGKIWAFWNNKRRQIRSEVILNSYDSPVLQSVSDLTLGQKPINNLVRVKDDIKVYALNDLGFKRWIQNPGIFNSYNLNWNDVAEISSTELDGYKDTNILKEVSNDKVYFLEGTAIRPIKDLSTFNYLKLDWNALQIINLSDLQTYILGEEIAYEAPGGVLEPPTAYETPTPSPSPTPSLSPSPISQTYSVSLKDSSTVDLSSPEESLYTFGKSSFEVNNTGNAPITIAKLRIDLASINYRDYKNDVPGLSGEIPPINQLSLSIYDGSGKNIINPVAPFINNSSLFNIKNLSIPAGDKIKIRVSGVSPWGAENYQYAVRYELGSILGGGNDVLFSDLLLKEQIYNLPRNQ